MESQRDTAEHLPCPRLLPWGDTRPCHGFCGAEGRNSLGEAEATEENEQEEFEATCERDQKHNGTKEEDEAGVKPEEKQDLTCKFIVNLLLCAEVSAFIGTRDENQVKGCAKQANT